MRALDAFAVTVGPGSFTGLRTACSVSQGLAFGLGIGILPIDTLLALAEEGAVLVILGREPLPEDFERALLALQPRAISVRLELADRPDGALADE